MDKKELLKLSKSLLSYGTEAPSNYSFIGEDGQNVTLKKEAMETVLRDNLKELTTGSPYAYEKNKYDIFEIITKSVDLREPKELSNLFEGYVKVLNFDENEDVEIEPKRNVKNLRARSFVTKVSPAGLYETFKLAKGGKFKLDTTAIGGAAAIAYTDYITGRYDWNELIDIIVQGTQDRILEEILAVVGNIEKNLPGANKGTCSSFDAKTFEKVLDTIEVYGRPVVFCTSTFARAITEGVTWASEKEKEARRKYGYMADYKNAKIVILPQSFTDETNTTKVVDPTKAWIFPESVEPMIYVASKGPTHIKEVENTSDWSKELHTYKQFGVAAIVYNDLGTFEITGLAG